MHKDKNKLRDLKKIIKEESQVLITEADLVKDDRFRFADVINADFYHFDEFSNDYDIDILTSKITVYWNAVFWVNPTGINKFMLEIEKVEGFFTVKYLDKQTDELMQETQKNIADYKWKFSINDEDGLQIGRSLYPLELDFDFKTNMCIVSF